ncbi:MAG: CbtA family protein [Gammaproteobacteria bacterium]|nr:CbtA family protein [Gammaproteobacteria bacterium]
MLFRQVVFYALLVGVLSGLALTVVQSFQVVPIILAAEEFEGAVVEAEATVIPALQSAGHHAATEEEVWAPANGWERTAFTMLSNSLTAMAFALILMAAMLASFSLKAGEKSLKAWWYGLAWGVAGYVAFWLAPAIGLPPEIPLQATAPLEHRQLWWVFAVICTVGGLAGLAFGQTPWRWIYPVFLIVPHLVGAPHPEGLMFPDQVPVVAAELEKLAQQFIGATAIANGILWLVIGVTAAWSVKRIVVALKAESSPGTGMEVPSV